MKAYRAITLRSVTVAWILGRCVFSTLSAAGDAPSPVDFFAADGSNLITAPEHLGIINGKLTLGSPARQAAQIDGLWAPPFVSSDFALRLEVFGKGVPTPAFKWWPYKIEQHGDTEGVDLSTTIVLASGRRAGLVAITLSNTTPTRVEVPLLLKAHGTLDYCERWEFAQATSTTATQPSLQGGSLRLSADNRSIVLKGGDDRIQWDPATGTGQRTLALPTGSAATVYLAFALGPAAEAASACDAIAADPPNAIADADAVHARQVEELFRRLPRLTAADPALERFYRRSLVHLILNRWDVPEFVLHPHYTTGSIRGGCVTEYLWNYGESWLMMPLFDPAANREHIQQFLRCDMTRHFAFNPVNGTAHGPWYMVNQEKIIGLIYQHVRITGDVAFLDTPVEGRTVLDHALKNATLGDDPSMPVALTDYGPSNSHLELRRQFTYHHVMPDLNGRRYANYLLAARLAELAGKPAPQLRERAAALRSLLRERLWNPQAKWFDYLNAQGRPETRWTVQMFYLAGSGVLDEETLAGLVGHLNEREFLGEYGLHSLAKVDPAYDPADVDNGGPGACTSFPPNIAIQLCQAGRQREAEDLMRRCVWWGSRMPYWGDSIYADRVDYRRDTPLQCTLDGVAVAQFFIFAVFGVDPQFDGSVLIRPRAAAFAPGAALRGIRMRGRVFEVELGEREFKVACGGKSLRAPWDRTIVIPACGATAEMTIR